MRKLLALSAVLLIAASAMAGPVSPLQGVLRNTPPTIGHTIGVYGTTTSGGPGLYSNISIPAAASDNFSVTFAFHWPFAGLTIYPAEIQYSLVWDNTELQITNVTPVGIFTGGLNNLPAPTFWTGITAPGLRQVGNVAGGAPIAMDPPTSIAPNSIPIGPSDIVPFVKVDFHVRGPIDDGFLDLRIGSAAMLFYSGLSSGVYFPPPTGGGAWWTGTGIDNTNYGLAITPEPASLALLGLGLATAGAGIWRRRH